MYTSCTAAAQQKMMRQTMACPRSWNGNYLPGPLLVEPQDYIVLSACGILRLWQTPICLFLWKMENVPGFLCAIYSVIQRVHTVVYFDDFSIDLFGTKHGSPNTESR